MSEVDPALHDESQQYGNLDETAAIARLPRNCLVLWLGDHRQTPVFANLRRLDDFDRSCCRPVALRRNSDKGPTKHPISGGSKVPHWYPPLPCLPSGPVDEARSPPPQNAQEQMETLARELLGTYAPWLMGIVPALLLLFYFCGATHRHEVESMVAQGLVETAGLRRKQKTGRLFCPAVRGSLKSLMRLRKLGTRILLPPALLSKQQDSPQLPQWIVNPFRTTRAHQTRSVLFT